MSRVIGQSNSSAGVVGQPKRWRRGRKARAHARRPANNCREFGQQERFPKIQACVVTEQWKPPAWPAPGSWLATWCAQRSCCTVCTRTPLKMPPDLSATPCMPHTPYRILQYNRSLPVAPCWPESHKRPMDRTHLIALTGYINAVHCPPRHPANHIYSTRPSQSHATGSNFFAPAEHLPHTKVFSPG